MYALLARYLLALPLMFAMTAAAEVDEEILGPRIAPEVAEGRDRLQAACESGDSEACQALQNLDEVLAAFAETNAACEEGEEAACRELRMGVALLETGSRCDSGEKAACEQLQIIDTLAPACDAGDDEACRKIEFVLFGF